MLCGEKDCPVCKSINNRVEIINKLLKNGSIINPIDYFRILNLSQEEIDALMAEIAKEQRGDQLDLFGYDPSTNGYGSTANKITPFGPSSIDSYKAIIKNQPCEHEWKQYVGFNHTDIYCFKCQKIKE